MVGQSIPGSRTCLKPQETFVKYHPSLTRYEEARQVCPRCPRFWGPIRKYVHPLMSPSMKLHPLPNHTLTSVLVNSIRHHRPLHPPPTPLRRQDFRLQTLRSYIPIRHPERCRGPLHLHVSIRRHSTGF